MSKSYELFVHHKQGDDFAKCVEAKNGDPAAGLRVWADRFVSFAETCRMLAAAFEGKRVRVQVADTHMISFAADNEDAERCLEGLAKAGILGVIDFPDDDE